MVNFRVGVVEASKWDVLLWGESEVLEKSIKSSVE